MKKKDKQRTRRDTLNSDTRHSYYVKYHLYLQRYSCTLYIYIWKKLGMYICIFTTDVQVLHHGYGKK